MSTGPLPQEQLDSLLAEAQHDEYQRLVWQEELLHAAARLGMELAAQVLDNYEFWDGTITTLAAAIRERARK